MAWITPIYDRTQKDVDERNSKSFINYTDVNRMINNLKEVYEKFHTFFEFYPRDYVNMYDFHEYDYIYVKDINKIINNINVFARYCELDDQFVLLNKFTGGEFGTNPGYEDYNSIEKDIEFLYNNINNNLEIAESEEVADGFDGGDGTINNPYLIRTPAQLAYLSVYTAAGNSGGQYFKQIANINLNGKYNWYKYCIGTQSRAFRGNYDGNNKTVIKIKFEYEGIYPQNSKPYGMFGEVSGIGLTNFTAGVFNLMLDNIIYHQEAINTEKIPSNFGFIVGSLSSLSAVVRNCSVNSYIGRGRILALNFGTICGTNFGEIYDCYANSDFTAIMNNGALNIGGIVGNLSDAKIYNCESFGDIYGVSDANDTYDTATSIGGIAGEASSSFSRIAEIYKCKSGVNITGEYGFVGGIVGITSSGKILNCHCVGELKISPKETHINNKNIGAGGIIGAAKRGYSTESLEIIQTYFNSTISNEGYYGLISSAHLRNMGGIIGYVESLGEDVEPIYITNCYSSANFSTIYNRTISTDGSVGGLIGKYDSGKLQIGNTYSNSRYSGPTIYVYGVIGQNASSDNISMSEVYFEKAERVYEESSYGVAKTKTEMKNRETYENWDFINVWGMSSNKNSGYPYLLNT